MEKKAGWKDLPIGGLIPEAGSANDYVTGGWRTFKPIFDPTDCINCLTCFYLCPDSAIIVEEGKMKGIHYAHCKGCGICAHECPVNKRGIKKPPLVMKLESN